VTRVLLVTGDDGAGFRLAEYLESRNLEVMFCPGPVSPSYVCLGGRGAACPLAAAADVVVLDGWLHSDALRAGTPSWHLLLYYRQRGLPVVFLVGPDGLAAPARDADVRTLPRDADFEQIAEAVLDLAFTKVAAPRMEELA
jgi:hypothetical protein